MKTQATAQQISQQDQKVRELYSRENLTFKGTKEEALEAIKFKIQEELVIHRNMQALIFTTSEAQRQSNQAIEMSRMSDKIKEKFGFDIDELGIAFNDFNLKEDKTYKSFAELARV